MNAWAPPVVARWLIVFGMMWLSLHAATEPPRPNIVFILADDLGYGDLGCYGHERLRTPNLDRLAGEGTRFTQFYVSHSVCSPTRVSAITGQHPSRWHIYAHLAWLAENATRGMPDWLDPSAPSMPRAMQRAGYRTALLGKWHLGGGSGHVFGGKAINSPDAPPVAAYGFDEVRTTFGNGPTWKGGQPVDRPHDTYPLDDIPWITWSSQLVVDAAMAFIDGHTRDHPGRPFMMNLWLHDPHVPLKPTDDMRKPYEDVADPGIQTYYAVITHMDRQIGRFLERLDQAGLRDNTLVIFTSDNGAPSRQGSADSGRRVDMALDSAGSNGPLRGWKWHLREGGIRVPFIARWPGRIPTRRTDTTSVLNVCDLTPTFLRLAGASMPKGYQPDGVDMTDALFGKPFARSQPMFWHNPTANRRGPVLAIREGDWKLSMEPDGTEIELYDLAHDMSESVNVADANPGVVKMLAAKLRGWHQSLPKPLDRPFGNEKPRTK